MPRFTLENTALNFGVRAEKITPKKHINHEIYHVDGEEENIENFWSYLFHLSQFRRLEYIKENNKREVYIGRVCYEMN